MNTSELVKKVVETSVVEVLNNEPLLGEMLKAEVERAVRQQLELSVSGVMHSIQKELVVHLEHSLERQKERFAKGVSHKFAKYIDENSEDFLF